MDMLLQEHPQCEKCKFAATQNSPSSCFNFGGLFDICLKHANHRQPMVISKLLCQINIDRIFISNHILARPVYLKNKMFYSSQWH
jgi:hypothetical protein